MRTKLTTNLSTAVLKHILSLIVTKYLCGVWIVAVQFIFIVLLTATK